MPLPRIALYTIVFCALSLFLVASFLPDSVFAAIFFLYVLVCVVLIIAEPIIMRRSIDPVRMIGEEYSQALEPGPIERLQRRISTALIAIARAIVWPATQSIGFGWGVQSAQKEGGLPKLSELGAYMDLNKPDMPCSLFGFAVVIAGAAAHDFFHSNSPYLFSAISIAVASAAVRHLEYLIGPSTLQQRLRSSIAEPMFLFTLILMFDFVALVLAYTVLINWETVGLPGYEEFRKSVEAMFANTTLLTEVWQHPDRLGTIFPRWREFAPAISGALFAAAVAKSVLKRSEFARRDEDRVKIGAELALLGQFDQAYIWADRAEESRSQFAVKTISALGRGDFAMARDWAERLTKRFGEGKEQETFVELFDVVNLFPVSETTAITLVERMIGWHASDGILSFGLCNLVWLRKLSGPNALALIEKSGQQAQLPLASAVSSWLSTDTFAQFEKLEPLSPFERSLYRTYQFCAEALNKAPDDFPVFMHDWAGSRGEDLRRAVEQLPQDYERRCVYSLIVLPTALEQIFGSGKSAFFSYVAEGLKKRLAPSQINNVMTRLWQRRLQIAIAQLRQQVARRK